MITAATRQAKPATVWNYSVYAVRNEQGEKIDRLLMTSGGDSLESAIRRIIADVAYYVGCGYQIEVRDVAEVCSKCCGEGSIKKKRGRFYSDETTQCKACKGVGGFTRLGTIGHPEFSCGMKIVL